jgi:type VI secretion system lysozyme-like protein
MAKAAVITGGPKLLFERLAGDAADAAGAMHDWEGLRISVITEVHRLFNTRLSLDAARLAQRRRRSTVDYGIPDLSLFPVRDAEAEATLVRHLTEALQAFEPRLCSPKVTLERVPGPDGGLVAHVSGEIRVRRMTAPLSFPVSVRRHGG